MSELDNPFVDSFSEQDVADPELLPENTKYVGQITRVNIEKAKPGNFQKFPKGLKDGRTEVPIIRVSVNTKVTEGGDKLSGQNVNRFADLDFWVGAPDVSGKAQLRKLIMAFLDLKKEELIGQSMTGLAEKLVGGWLKYEVKHTSYTDKDGNVRNNQKIIKYKVASADDMGLVM